IQDTAAEFWSRVAQNNSPGGVFMVTDPQGEVIASLGGNLPQRGKFAAVRDAAKRFPEQSDGFSLEGGQLYELVVTPVYVQTQGGSSALLNVLVAGFPVNQNVARDLKDRTGGSDFIFLSGGLPVASTLDDGETKPIANQYRRVSSVQDLKLDDGEFAVLGATLHDLSGAPAGDLLIIHNFESI